MPASCARVAEQPRRCSSGRRAAGLLALLIVTTPASAAAPAPPADHARKMAQGRELFVKHVRPLLQTRCLKCHGGDKTRGDLDLSSRATLLKGGEHGAAIVLYHGRNSRLYQLVTHADKPHMPPASAGPRLTAAEVNHLAAWIDLGAPYDQPLLQKAPEKKPLVVTAADRAFWSFRPLHRPALPAVKRPGWCRTPVDAFVLAKLEEKKLAPAPEAERRTLARRASFDLTGLPPTPAEMERFLADTAPDAYERLLDRLLASEHFGERWGRHWLDVARFAESHGFEHDYDRPSAYHFRDFVIQAFNQDLPFDTFVRWQIAGDELAPDQPLALMATGYLAAGVHSTQITISQVEKERYDELDDMVRTLGTSMLGLTIGCARCHDHKYDPIPTRDYYRLLSTFTTTVRSEAELALGPGFAAVKQPKAKKTKVLICSEGVKPIRLHSQGADFLKETHFLKRGDPNQKIAVATQGFLQVLTRAADEKRWLQPPPKGWHTSYRRRSLAAWITDGDHGAGHLLARVIVNRLWQHHLGRGIVATPGDFGFQGERPTHPELLDYLATELIRNGWHLKPIHKLIMQSAVYRQGTRHDAEMARIDPDNHYLWRRQPRRLEAEIVRDALLAVSGTLDPKPFGPGTLDPNMRRRSIYFTVKRSQLVPSMVLFDAPDTLQGTEQRQTTTIAPQALLLMNNSLVRSCAEAFARRIAPAAGTKPADAVSRGYALALGRPPSAQERAEAVDFVQKQAESYRQERKGDAEHLAWTDFCQVLMELNEFVYVD